MAKASDNIFPLLRLAPGSAPATPAAGQAVLYVDSADGSFKTKDSTGTVKAVGGGGGGGGSRDYRWFVPSGATSIDEFNDDTLDAAWVRVDGTGATSANAIWTEAGDSLSLYQVGGDASGTVRGLVRPLSAFGGTVNIGDAFVTCLRPSGPQTSFIFGGVMLSDGVTFGSGGQVFAAAYIDGGVSPISVNSYNTTNWTGAAGSATIDAMRGDLLHLRLVKTGASTWRADMSPDGVSWLKGTALTTKTLTPTHVGLVSSSFGTATRGVVSYDYVRRVTGVS